MNVNVIDNQLLESLNNYFNTLSKTGYIKSSNSEALLVLSFLQEITSDYTDLVTFLNSLSENYCIIPFLDLSTCKVNLNSSDQLVRFTANLDNVSAYINTSYLNNQLINFPYMAITGKSIQINDILAEQLGPDSSTRASVFGNTSKKFVGGILLDGHVAATGVSKQSSYPITIDVDHEVSTHALKIDLYSLPSYTVTVISTKDLNGISLLDGESILPAVIYDGDTLKFDIANRASFPISSSANSFQYKDEVALTTNTGDFTSFAGSLHINGTTGLDGMILSTGRSFEEMFDCSAIKGAQFGSTHYPPIFISNDYNGYRAQCAFDKVLGSYNRSDTTEGDEIIWFEYYNAFNYTYDSGQLVLAGGNILSDRLGFYLADIERQPDRGFLVGVGNANFTIEAENYNNIVISNDIFIIPTTREDGTAEDILGDEIEISSMNYANAYPYLSAGRTTETVRLSTLISDSTKDHLIWSGKLFTDSVISIHFKSPEGTTLEISTASLVTSDKKTFANVTLTTSGSGNFNNVSLAFTTLTPNSHLYFLKIGGHIQYNTTTVNITGNISNMSVNIEGKGTVSLPASIQVNKP